MTSVVILLISLMLLFIVLWRIEKDFLSPSILIVISFIAGVVLLINGHNRLEIKTISNETVLLLFLGILAFIAGGVVSKNNKNNKRFYNAFNNPKPINITIKHYILFTIYSAVTAYIQFRHEMNYVGFAGTFTEIVSEFRNDAVAVESTVSKNEWVNINSRIVFALQPLLIFTILYNKIICKKRITRPAILLLCAFIYTASVFVMAGSRGRLFSFFFHILFSAVICYNFSGGTSEKKTLLGNKIMVKVGIFLILIGIPLFYFSGALQGKNYEDKSVFEPAENYFSVGIIHLDHTITSSTYKSEHFGQWSFSGFYSFLNKTGEKYKNYDILPFYGRYGNTVTIFGRWYQDFNVIGVIIMAFLTGFIFSKVYNKMLYANNIRDAFFYSVFFVFLINRIVMACYDDWIREFVSINCIFQIIVLICSIKYISNKFLK